MSENSIIIKPKLNPKQKQALRILTEKREKKEEYVSELLYGGGAGGGKSYLGCLWIIISAIQYPETRWLIGRSRLKTLIQTTLATFFKVCKDFKIKEGEHYTYNQQRNEIKFYNESVIILKDLFSYPGDPEFDSLGGLEISGAFIDEANQCSEKAKNVVMSRIRYKLDEYNLKPMLLMTCNPARNWVYNEYYNKKKTGNLEVYKEFIQALVTDNSEFISETYINNLRKLDDISRKRLLNGEWEYADSSDMFDYDSTMQMFEISEHDNVEDYTTSVPYYLSVDVARLGKDKTCIIVWHGLNIVDIVEMSKKTLDIQRDKIEEIKKEYGIQNANICIDTDGVGGGLADMLKGCKHIVNNSKPTGKENYQNLKTQLYFKLSEMVNSNSIKIFVKDLDIKTRLMQELQVLKREKIDEDGKVRMTTKEAVKTNIGRSPDISDAMAFKMIYHTNSTGYLVMGNEEVMAPKGKVPGSPKKGFRNSFNNFDESDGRFNGEDNNEFIFFGSNY